jgi:hypothetical protein
MGDKNMYKTELYFGMAIGEKPGQKLSDIAQDVSDDDFRRFVSATISTKFPDGLTIINAIGQYLMESDKNVVREQSRIVIILHDNDLSDDIKINDIRESYKRLFDQESVLRIDTECNVRF